MASSETVVVAKYQIEHEAELARAFLEAEGIVAGVMSDTGGHMFPSFPILFPFRLVVHASDAELARQIIEEMRAGPGNHPPDRPTED
jgi:hypothetical protein